MSKLKSVIETLEIVTKFQYEFQHHFLQYREVVLRKQLMSETEYFQQYLAARSNATEVIQNQFLSISVPKTHNEKCIVLTCFYSMLLLFPNKDIYRRVIDFGVSPKALKFFTPLANLIVELKKLEATGFTVKWFETVYFSENILCSQVAFEVLELFKVYDDSREEVFKRGRRKKSFEVDGDKNSQRLAELLSNNQNHVMETLAINRKQFRQIENKISAGFVPASMYEDLSGAISHSNLKKSKYYAALVPLLCLLTKSGPISEDEHLSKNTGPIYYESVKARWAKRQMLKKS